MDCKLSGSFIALVEILIYCTRERRDTKEVQNFDVHSNINSKAN